jgi:hypothetical protein
VIPVEQAGLAILLVLLAVTSQKALRLVARRV